MRTLAAIGVLAIIIAVGAAVFLFGGFFNVAVSEPFPSFANWALIQVRMASVERHAGHDSPANLDDPEVVHAGARAFSGRGCTNCHGAPGVNWQKFSEGMDPDPPDLKEIVPAREPAQLFWVIKNGIKMTGMPSFSAIGTNDNEIWSIVAFVRKLPNVSDAEFKAWTANP